MSQQQHTTTRRCRPPVPSWATKNTSGFHGNTTPGRMRLLDRAFFLMQIPPFNSNMDVVQQQQQLMLSRRKLFAWQQENTDTEVRRRNTPISTVNNGISVVVVVVDVGIGDDPATTIEFATALQQPQQPQQQQQHSDTILTTIHTPSSSSSVVVIGTEVDADRLQHAKAVLCNSITNSNSNSYANSADVLERISLRLGTTDFCLPLLNYQQSDNNEIQQQQQHQQQHQNNEQRLPQPRQQQQQQQQQLLVLVRAMNVLRDYPVPDAIVALRQLYHQLSSGGILVEGSAETQGRIVVALVLHKPHTHEHEQHVEDNNDDDDDDDEEEEICIAAVIFAADLEALELDPEYADPFLSSPAKWFNRHNHVPRLYRSYCDTSDCSSDQVPMWAAPMRSFLERWEDTTTTTTTPSTDLTTTSTTTDTKDNDTDNEKERTTTTTTTTQERFRKSVMTLKEAQQEEEEDDTVVTDWVDEGIVVWVPGERKKLLLPDLEEWTCYRQRTMHVR